MGNRGISGNSGYFDWACYFITGLSKGLIINRGQCKIADKKRE